MSKNNKHPEKEQSKFDLFFNQIFDSIPGNLVVVDSDSKIVKVNQNWNNFALENGVENGIEWMGQDYLEICKKITGFSNETAREACLGIKSILSGSESNFTLEYSNQNSTKECWFRLQANGFDFDGKTWVTIIHEDITETKIQEFALKSSEKQFQTTFEQAAVGIAHVAPEGKIMRVNQKFCDILGYSNEELLRASFQDITHPDDLELDLDNVNKLLEGELETYAMEKRYFHKNGAIIWANLTVSLLRTSAGKPNYFISVIEEITAKIEAENRVKESEEKFRALVDQSPIAIQVHGLDGKLITSNAAWRELNAFDDEVLAEVKEKYSILEDEQARELGIMPSIETVYAGESVEFPLYSYTVFDTLEKLDFANSVPMPRTRWIQTRGFPLKDEAGRVTSAVFMSEDITEQKLAEMELQESEEKFRSLMEQSPLSIQICDKDGNLVDGNKAWKQLWNISEEDMPYVKANYNILKDEEVKKRGILPLIEKAYAGEAVEPPDFFYESAGEMDAMGLAKEKAKAVWLRIKLYPVLDEAGDVKNVISIEEDITEHKQAENALKESEANFRDLVEQNPLYIEIYGPDGQLTHMNTAYKNLLDLNEELSQLLYGNYNLFEDEYAIINGLGPGIKNVFAGEYFEFNEYEFDIDLVRSWLGLENKNRGKLWFKATGFPIKDENGNVKQVVFLSQNVSARVSAEQELEKARRFTDKMVETANVMIVGVDAKGNVNLLNPTAERITGYTLAEMKGENWFEVLVPKEKYPEVHKEFNRLIEQKDIGSFQNPILTKNGEERFISWSNSAIYTGDEKHGLISFGHDITEQKTAELALIDSEENYRLLIEQANDGIVLIQDGRVKFVNTALTRLTGYTVDELLESSIFDYIEENELEKVKLKYTKRMKGEGVPPYESKLVRKNGEIFEVEFNGGLAFYNGAVADLAMVRDITERKKAEKERNRLFNLSSDLIGIAGFDGIFNQINPAWETTLGYSLDQLMANPFMDFIHPEDHEITGREMKKLAAGQTTINFENRYIHKDGSIKHISWTATPVLEESVLYCIGRDITEYKKHEEVLKESEEKFRMLVDQSPFSIQVFNPDGRIDRVNKAFTKLWGVEGKELQEVLDNYNVLEDKEAEKLGVASAIQSVFRGGESVILPLIEYDAESTMDAAGVNVKANKQWIQARLYPVKNSKGEVVNVVDMEEDMTIAIQKEQEILNYQQRLKALSSELIISEERQRRAIATDLHDHVGQMLASSRLQIAALTDKLEKQEILQKLKDISLGLLQGIQATRNAIFELSPPQLNEIGLVAAISDWMDEELETKHNINVNLTADNKVFLIDEDIRILTFRCVRELLMNVVKHAKASQVDLDIKESTGSLFLSLNDNGIGFNYSPAYLRAKGSGFGLFSIQERIEDIGGSMEINSEKGKGTSVKLIVPLKD